MGKSFFLHGCLCLVSAYVMLLSYACFSSYFSILFLSYYSSVYFYQFFETFLLNVYSLSTGGLVLFFLLSQTLTMLLTVTIYRTFSIEKKLFLSFLCMFVGSFVIVLLVNVVRVSIGLYVLSLVRSLMGNMTIAIIGALGGWVYVNFC